MNSGEVKTRPDSVMLGITLMVIAVFMMSIQEASFKQFSAELSLWQIFTLRGLFAVSILFLIILVKGQQRQVWTEALGKWPVLRSLFMTMVFIPMYASFPFLSLSTVAARMYTTPIFVALMSSYAIGEPVGGFGWLAIAMEFAGVLVILQPGADGFSLWALCPVLGGFFYALANVTTRSKCQSVSLPALSLSLNLALLVAGIIFSLVTIFFAAQQRINSFSSFFTGWLVSHRNIGMEFNYIACSVGCADRNGTGWRLSICSTHNDSNLRLQLFDFYGLMGLSVFRNPT